MIRVQLQDYAILFMINFNSEDAEAGKITYVKMFYLLICRICTIKL